MLGVVLLIGSFLGVAVWGGLAGHAVDGAGVRAELPDPPPMGTCLRLAGAVWMVSSCGEPHTVEVVRVWSAARAPKSELYDGCVQAAQAYVGEPSDLSRGSGWVTPPVMFSQTLLSGPLAAAVEGWNGYACVIRPIVPDLPAVGYRGRLKGVEQTDGIPIDVRPCYNRPDDDAGLVGVSCAARHVGQILAVRMLRLAQPNQLRDHDPVLEEQCRNMAERSGATAGAGPRHLYVVIYLRATGMGSVTSASLSTENELAGDYTLYQASCAIQALPAS